MKLYRVPKYSTIKVLDDIAVPPGAPPIEKGDILNFHGIDGMYSKCSSQGVLYHLVAWAEVEIIPQDKETVPGD